MSLSIIAAMTEERVIGLKGKLPWHLPEDLKHFKEITMGKPVIMGRKTYESMGRLLPGRQNIIISHNPAYAVDGATTTRSLQEAIIAAEQVCGKNNEFFVIGGGEIFQFALAKAHRIYLTLIHHSFEGDAYFPELNLEKDFKVVEKSSHESAGKEKLKYTFIKAERK